MKKAAYAILSLGVFIIVISTGILFFRPSLIIPKETAKKELSLPESHFIQWRGAELHYVVQGHGYPLMLIHGFGASLRSFDKLTPLITDSFTVIRVDLPGAGLSDLPDMKGGTNFLAMYTDYLTFMLDTLHLDSLYVAGNSLGGGLAWLMAAQHPDKVKKLVLLNSGGYDVASVVSKLPMAGYERARHVFDKGMPVFLSRASMLRCFADPSKGDPEVWKLNNKFTNREGNIQSMLTLARTKYFPDTTLIQTITCPTLIIWGKQDAIIPALHAEKFHRDIKNSRVLLYDPCGHLPMQECPIALARDLRAFLRN
jgi:pimeloyl-ACP methyl ester carboxylesterase